jgi:hypothetical protein
MAVGAVEMMLSAPRDNCVTCAENCQVERPQMVAFLKDQNKREFTAGGALMF